MIQLLTGFWDRLGIGVSGLCAIHCMVAPVLVSLIPFWPSLEVFHDYSHLVFLMVIIPVVYFSLKKSFESKTILLMMLAGLLIIFAAWLFRDPLGEIGESLVTLSGSALLIRGHWLNYKNKCSLRYETA
jgi:hypothetical protein